MGIAAASTRHTARYARSATSPVEREFAFSEDEAEWAGEDVAPFVAGVADERRLPGREDLLEGLNPPRVLGQGHQNAARPLTPAARRAA
jgi:hypothetical protein